jgi:hypothetical protein
MGTQLTTGEHRQGLLNAATEFAIPKEAQVTRFDHGATTLLDKNWGHYRMLSLHCQLGQRPSSARGREAGSDGNLFKLFYAKVRAPAGLLKPRIISEKLRHQLDEAEDACG